MPPPGHTRVSAAARGPIRARSASASGRSTGRVADRARGPVERELGRLDVAVQVAVELLGDPEGHERGRALRVGRQLADLDAAVRAAQRRHPFGAMRGEVVLGEPARGGDGRGDRARVDRVGPAIGDRLQRRRRGRAGGSARPGRGAGHGARACAARQCSAIRAVAATPLRAASIAPASAASSPRRPKRSATSAHARTAPGTVTERGPRSRRSARRCAPAPAPSR